MVARRSLTSKEAGYRFWLTSPLGFVLGARGKGVSEEGGKRVDSRVFISWKQGKEYVDAESEDDAMSLKKRHIGRRVAGVGVGVALIVLGLEAPAFAAPTVTSFTPTSGPSNCVTVVTGTGFTDFPQDQIRRRPSLAPPRRRRRCLPTPAGFLPSSRRRIWAVVAGRVDPGVSYNVRVTNDPSTAGVTSTATFLNTGAAGACAPTITSFAADVWTGGTTVVITGTNLIEQTSTALKCGSARTTLHRSRTTPFPMSMMRRHSVWSCPRVPGTDRSRSPPTSAAVGLQHHQLPGAAAGLRTGGNRAREGHHAEAQEER